jgi:hypothetical protein
MRETLWPRYRCRTTVTTCYQMKLGQKSQLKQHNVKLSITNFNR